MGFREERWLWLLVSEMRLIQELYFLLERTQRFKRSHFSKCTKGHSSFCIGSEQVHRFSSHFSSSTKCSVSTVHLSTSSSIAETLLPKALVQGLSTVHALPLSSIIKTLVAKPPVDLVHCSFTSKMVLTSLQSTSSSQSSFSFNRNSQLSVLKNKVPAHHKKTQFLKESHLHYKKPKPPLFSKDHFSGSGWKKK